MQLKNLTVFLLSLTILTPLVFAHVSHTEEVRAQIFLIDPIQAAVLATIAVLSLAVISILLYSHLNELHKKLLFGLMALVILAVTLYLAGSTVYFNLLSETKGPVHWHADFEIWNCGERVHLKEAGLEGRTGTSLQHAHNDDRIHIEGTVFKKEDIGLGEFFEALGGELRMNELHVETHDGSFLDLHSGETLCNEMPGQLQVFVFKTSDHKITQEKLLHPEDYILSPYITVPPGDCIIIEFDQAKDRTDKLCLPYQQALEKGELSWGDSFGR